jgi:hypothetical protein
MTYREFSHQIPLRDMLSLLGIYTFFEKGGEGMSQRPTHHSNFSLVLIFSASLVVFGLPFTAIAQKAAGPWSQLIDKAQNQGQTRVIVRLREKTPLSKNLSTHQARINRQQAIRSLQDDFILNLGRAGMKTEHLKRFKYFPFIALHVDSATLQALQNSPGVAGIEEDTLDPPSLATSVPLIGADNAHTQGFDGTGWAVAILDTGVDNTHSFFGGRVVAEACFSTTSIFSNSTSVCPGGGPQSTAPGYGVNCDATDPGPVPISLPFRCSLVLTMLPIVLPDRPLVCFLLGRTRFWDWNMFWI